MANVAPGKSSNTAWAITWVVEWRIVYSPRSDEAVTISTLSPSSSTQSRSRSVPFTTPMTASLASRRPIPAANSITVVPAGTDRCESSGNVIVMSAIVGW